MRPSDLKDFDRFITRLRYDYHKVVLFERFDKFEKVLYHNRRCYKRLSRKYGDFIAALPDYEGGGHTSRTVWWCWFQGEENAPELTRACLRSLREHLKDREIVVITEENMYDYIDFPDYIKEKYRKGIISRTHLSDLIRLQLLIKYGGTWIDSSVYCTGYNKISESFFDKDLFVFSHWKRGDIYCRLSNWFITSGIGNPLLMATRDLLFEYWRRENRVEDYFIFHLFFTMATERYPDEWKKVHRFSNVPPHILQFEITDKFDEERFNEIKLMSDFHKLTQKADFSECKGDTFYDHIINS